MQHYRELRINAVNQEKRRRGDTNMQLFLADVYAVQGKFSEAARIYKKIGQPSRAMTMYTDLRMFDLAKVCSFIMSALSLSSQ